MSVEWTKAKFLGVRYREHRSRKNGVNLDRCFSIRYKLDGKDKEEVCGWASEGWTAEKAFKALSAIRENIKTGLGPTSLAQQRTDNQAKTAALQQEAQEKEKENITFGHFFTAEYTPSAFRSKKKITVEREQLLYRLWIAPVLGDIPIKDVTVANMEKIVANLQKKSRSAATIRYVLAIARQVWNYAFSRDIVLGENPVRKIKKPRADNRRVRFLTAGEAKRLFDALKIKSIDCYGEAVIALFAGLRAGEIHALTWSDCDFTNKTIYIRDPKNKMSRHAYMTEEIFDVLQNRHKQAQRHEELVFPARDGSIRVAVSKTFEKVVTELGLNNTVQHTTNAQGEAVPIKISDARQKVVFHTLRHTFASWLVQAGTPLYTVAELMGHSSLEMTKRYAHLAPENLRKAALSLQGKLTTL